MFQLLLPETYFTLIILSYFYFPKCTFTVTIYMHSFIHLFVCHLSVTAENNTEFSQKLKMELTHDPEIFLVGINPKEMKSVPLRASCSLANVPCSIDHNIQDLEMTDGWTDGWLNKEIAGSSHCGNEPDKYP